MRSFLIACSLACGLAFLTPTRADEPKAAAVAAPDYNQHISPLLRKYCLGCHDAETAEGGLILEPFDKLLKGGKHGAAVIPGASDRSRLYRMLTGDVTPKMPPPDNQAPKPEEIALVKAWIDAGAKGPSGAALDPLQLVTPVIPLKQPAKFAIYSVAWSPDGKQLAIGGYREVRLVDRATQTIVQKWSDLANNITAVSFSSDGKRLLAAGGEPGLYGEAYLWRIPEGNLLQKFRGHTDSLYGAELSPDGKLLATGSYDKLAILWDTATGKEVRTLKNHNDAVYGLSFSPDGAKLATASGDSTAKLWNVATGERLETFGQHLKGVYTVAYHPDGRRLVTGSIDSRLRIYEVSPSGKEGTNPLLASLFAHQGPILRIAFSRDGAHLASTSEDRTVKLWDGKTLKERLVLETQPDWVYAVAFSPDGKSLLVGRYDGSLAIYDTEKGTKQQDLQPKLPVPELSSVWPPAAQSGKPIELTVTGKHLVDVHKVAVSGKAIEAKVLERAADKLVIEVTAPETTPRGKVEISVTTPGGTAKLPIYVDELTQTTEREPNNSLTQAQPLAWPAGVWGKLSQQGDADFYSVEAQPGQLLVFELTGQQIGSKVNAVLTLHDAAGHVLASSNTFDEQMDPLFAYPVTAAGKYIVRVRDLLLTGSNDHFYRLSVGTLPLVTGVYPLSVPPNAEAKLQLAGFNLPAGAEVTVKAGASGMVPVPLEAKFRSRKAHQVVVGDLPEQLEQEPNDTPDLATKFTAPAVLNGRILKSAPAANDADLYRFTAKAGEPWIIETDASRRGSPIDTRLEVLHADGRPVERLLLQATRDSYITFRSINSKTLDARVKNWEEMELREYLYLQGEVCRIFRMPQGPDSGFNFFARDGVRRCYFDTSPTTHALDEPAYIVEPHPPGTPLVPNGLPVFSLHYQNDDDGERTLGRDSRLTFTAPRDDDYLVRVTDTRGDEGDRFAYRLIVRKPQPDFRVSVRGGNPTVTPGCGKSVTLFAERIDGFDGDIRVDLSGLSPGVSIDSPVIIQAGHLTAQTVVWATADAVAAEVQKAGPVQVTATAEVNGQPVTHPVNGFGKVTLGAAGKIKVRLDPAVVELQPGRTVLVNLIVERNDFAERIQFDVNNLPHGVYVDNIGLNGVLIPEGQTERQVSLTARKWVGELERPFHAVSKGVGDVASPPILLRVRPRPNVAQAETAPTGALKPP